MSQESDDRLANVENAMRDLCYGVLGMPGPDGLPVQVCILCRIPKTQPHAIGCKMARLFAGIEVQRPRLLVPANGTPHGD